MKVNLARDVNGYLQLHIQEVSLDEEEPGKDFYWTCLTENK